MSNHDISHDPPSRSDAARSDRCLERILLIDDSLTVRIFVDSVLSDAGYEVESAPDVASGLAAMDRARPDMVLLDVRLPDMDTVTAATAVRERDTRGETVLLLYSGRSVAEMEALAARCGANGYFEKTHDPEKLLRIVENAWAGQDDGGVRA